MCPLDPRKASLTIAAATSATMTPSPASSGAEAQRTCHPLGRSRDEAMGADFAHGARFGCSVQPDGVPYFVLTLSGRYT